MRKLYHDEREESVKRAGLTSDDNVERETRKGFKIPMTMSQKVLTLSSVILLGKVRLLLCLVQELFTKQDVRLCIFSYNAFIKIQQMLFMYLFL